MEIWEPWGSTG